MKWPQNAHSLSPHLLEEQLLGVDHPNASWRSSSRLSKVVGRESHSGKNWYRARQRALSSFTYKGRLRKHTCILQSRKEHRALCLHGAKDLRSDLFTILEISSYRLTILLPNSQRAKLIIVIIKLKVRKLLVRNLHPVMNQSRVYLSQFFLRVQINISPCQGAVQHFNGLVGCSFEPRGQLLKLKVSREANRRRDCQSKQVRSRGRLSCALSIIFQL